ncbi:MAG: c-type cytochrome domain-containing protein [Ignavibacteria bacterium]|nr:c-type cytochrome domain-containing protein [Ignavibacteria bacterium]
MKKIIVSLSLLFSVILVSFAGCKDTVTNQQVDDAIIPASGVSFGKHIQPIFNVKCNSSQCHNDETKAGGLSLTSWTNAFNAGVINESDTTTSRLVWAIKGQSGSSSMPPFGYPGLTQNQINGIITWIKEGAKNN